MWWRPNVKKALSYVAIAIMLGTLTMLAPLMLVKSTSLQASGDGGEGFMGLPKLPTYCPEDKEGVKAVIVNETLQTRAEALERTLRPSNFSSAALILIPSFLLALGVSLYLKKRMS